MYYLTIISQILLTIGLYSACAGIDTQESLIHRKQITKILSLGVLLKALIISAILYFLGIWIYSVIFALIVTQIDPLSVAYLWNQHLSHKAKTILHFRANFDDPMTVLLLLYLALPLAWLSLDINIIRVYSLNILWIVLAYGARKRSQSSQIIVMIVLAWASIFGGATLAVAAAWLLLRPFQEKIMTVILKYVYWAVIWLFAILFLYQMRLWIVTLRIVSIGFILGCAGFFAQRLVTHILFWHGNSHDKKLLSIAQQNGLTSMVLALTLFAIVPDIIGITAIAIFTINSFHWITNKLVTVSTHK